MDLLKYTDIGGMYGAFFKLDDDAADTVVLNDAAAGPDGTLYGGDDTEDISQDPGKVGKSFLLDGAADYVSANWLVGRVGTGPFMVCAWIKHDNPSNLGMVVCKRVNIGGYTGYMMWLDLASRKIRWSTFVNSVWKTITQDVACTAGTWYFCLGLHSVANVNRLFVNNVTQGLPVSGADGDLDTASGFFISRLAEAAGYYWKGELDNVMMIRKEPTESERRFLYNNGNGQPSLIALPKALAAGGSLAAGRHRAKLAR